MIAVKGGVRLLGVQAPIVFALLVAEGVYDGIDETLVVTSLVDGKHMRASLHYVGAAVDVRLPKQRPEDIRQRIATMLGTEYDVVLEDDHIHIEWQPKVPL